MYSFRKRRNEITVPAREIKYRTAVIFDRFSFFSFFFHDTPISNIQTSTDVKIFYFIFHDSSTFVYRFAAVPAQFLVDFSNNFIAQNTNTARKNATYTRSVLQNRTSVLCRIVAIRSIRFTYYRNGLM